MDQQTRHELYNLTGEVAEHLDDWGAQCPAEHYLFWVKFFALRELVNRINREFGDDEIAAEAREEAL